MSVDREQRHLQVGLGLPERNRLVLSSFVTWRIAFGAKNRFLFSAKKVGSFFSLFREFLTQLYSYTSYRLITQLLCKDFFILPRTVLHLFHDRLDDCMLEHGVLNPAGHDSREGHMMFMIHDRSQPFLHDTVFFKLLFSLAIVLYE